MAPLLRRAFWGFFFGTAGVLILSGMLSYIVPFFATIGWFLVVPGNWISGAVAAPNSGQFETILGVFFNGLVYAFVFMIIGALFGRPRPAA